MAAISPYYSTVETAKLLRKHPHTMRTGWQRFGKVYGITPVKIGGRVLWPKDQVKRVLVGLPATEQGAAT